MLNLALINYAESRRRRLDALKDSKALYSPMVYIERLRLDLDNKRDALVISGNNMISEQRYILRGIIESMEHLGPLNVLKRGYAYVTSGGTAVTSVEGLHKGEDIDIIFSDGKAKASIIDTFRDEET